MIKKLKYKPISINCTSSFSAKSPEVKYIRYIGTLIGTISLTVHPLMLGDLDVLLELHLGDARHALD